MKECDKEKEIIKKNLAQAVINCKKLKFTNCSIESSFKVVFKSFLDFTEGKYYDGEHPFRVDVSIEITNSYGKRIEPSTASYTAFINGTDVTIENETLNIDKNIIVRL